MRLGPRDAAWSAEDERRQLGVDAGEALLGVGGGVAGGVGTPPRAAAVSALLGPRALCELTQLSHHHGHVVADGAPHDVRVHTEVLVDDEVAQVAHHAARDVWPLLDDLVGDVRGGLAKHAQIIDGRVAEPAVTIYAARMAAPSTSSRISRRSPPVVTRWPGAPRRSSIFYRSSQTRKKPSGVPGS